MVCSSGGRVRAVALRPDADLQDRGDQHHDEGEERDCCPIAELEELEGGAVQVQHEADRRVSRASVGEEVRLGEHVERPDGRHDELEADHRVAGGER